MVLPTTLLVSLDVISGALVLVIAGFFARIWSRSRAQLDALVAVGFGLLAVSYATTSLSRIAIGSLDVRWDYVRLGGQLAGSLVIAFAYVGARLRKPSVSWALSWTAATLGVAFLLAAILQPTRGALPPIQLLGAPAHAGMTLAWLATAGLASRAWGGRPHADRALVPLAFLAMAASKYTWLLTDLATDEDFRVFIYAWRFIAIGLLSAALLLPHARPGAQPHAAS